LEGNRSISFSRSQGNLPGVTYKVQFPQHWVFNTALGGSTEFTVGQNVGYDETDAAELSDYSGATPPRATGDDGTPLNFICLAIADCQDWEARSGGKSGWATMGIYQRNGTVFTAATINWASGLSLDGGWTAVDQITRNVLTNLVLGPLGSLSGTVRDTMGQPIAGATVTAGTLSSRSDATGAYSLAGLDPGPIEVTASAPGYDPTQTEVMIKAGAQVVHDIELTPASATLTGTVTAADDGSPIPEARVVVYGAGNAQTDDTGNYTVPNVSAGEHEVQVSARGFKPKTASIEVIAQQTLREDFVLDSLHPPPHGPGGQPL
jgi:hypothetical protein